LDDRPIIHEVWEILRRGPDAYSRPPVPILDIVRQLFPELELIGQPLRERGHLDTVSEHLNDIQAIIYYSTSEPRAWQRFAVAVLLGSWIFDHQRGKVQHDGPPSMAAVHFARELLISFHALDPHVGSDRSQLRRALSRLFEVPWSPMRIRLADLDHWRKLSQREPPERSGLSKEGPRLRRAGRHTGHGKSIRRK
jgi:hypothetical protein